MNSWIIWFLLGIFLICWEVLRPKYYLLSFGSGAIIAGLATFIRFGYLAQFILFCLTGFSTYLWFKKNAKKVFDTSIIDKKDVHGLVNQIGLVTEKISADGKGYVRINNDEWPATLSNKKHKEIEAGKMAVVKRLKGNRLKVSLAQEDKS